MQSSHLETVIKITTERDVGTVPTPEKRRPIVDGSMKPAEKPFPYVEMDDESRVPDVKKDDVETNIESL